MHISLAMQTCRNLKALYRKVVNPANKHPIIDFTNIEKVFKYDTPGPIDNTWTRWLKVNHKDGTSTRINYGHTQHGADFRDQLASALNIMGFPVKK